MLDLRYERQRLVSSSTTISDRYNAVGSLSSNHHHHHHHYQIHNNHRAPVEYWTNGTTTLILNSKPLPPSSSFSPSASSSIKSSLSNHCDFPPQQGNSSHRMTVLSQASSHNIDNDEIATMQTKLNQQLQHQQQQHQHVVRNSLFAGSIAGIASTLVCHPFDVIRTKMQSAAMESSFSSSSTTATATTTTTTAGRGPVQVISQTLKNGGIRALYTGLALPLAAQAVYKATVFTVNNVTQNFLVDWKTQERYKTGIFEPYSLSLSDRFVCGFVGGGVNAALFVTPVEYVRNQLIGQHSRRAAGQSITRVLTGPMDVIRTTVRSPVGIVGLWRGVSVTVARDSLGCGFFFYAMEWSQQYFAKYHHHQQQQQQYETTPLGVTIASGAVAGLAYWLVALPLDSVKTWVQSDMADSAIQAVKTSLREHGPKETLERLFSGFQVAYARGIPSAAITVTVYTMCYQAIHSVDP